MVTQRTGWSPGDARSRGASPVSMSVSECKDHKCYWLMFNKAPNYFCCPCPPHACESGWYGHCRFDAHYTLWPQGLNMAIRAFSGVKQSKFTLPGYDISDYCFDGSMQAGSSCDCIWHECQVHAKPAKPMIPVATGSSASRQVLHAPPGRPCSASAVTDSR